MMYNTFLLKLDYGYKLEKYPTPLSQWMRERVKKS